MKAKFHTTAFQSDRWPVFVRFHDNFDASTRPMVLIHSGWGKGFSRIDPLMDRLVAVGACPVAIDTRWAYSNRQPLKHSNIAALSKAIFGQHFTTGDDNRFFSNAQEARNRYELRKSTTLLGVCEVLGLESGVSIVGFSDGVRVSALAILQNPSLFDRFVAVNGAGAAQPPNPLRALAKSNAHRIFQTAAERRIARGAVTGAAESFLYAATHPRRTLREKSVILDFDLWESLGEINRVNPSIDIFFLHANGDALVPFRPSAARASMYPMIDFEPTNGDHSNFYEPHIQARIVERVMAPLGI